MENREGFRIRSALGRSMYDRIKRDNELRDIDKSQWYQVDLTQMPGRHADLFLPLSPDADTEAFLNTCHEKSDWLFTQLWHSVVKSVLTLFMTQTSINGWLRRGSMHVFSRQQLVRLLGVSSSWRAERLLDLGAGDGRITDIMAHHFHSVSVTEASSTMRDILCHKGFTVLELESWPAHPGGFDVISCLNLLDRCDRPLTILRQLREALPPDGRALVALVLPLSPYVEDGERGDHQPVETMGIEGTTFSRQASSFIEKVLEPAGFEVERWTRLPYLCEGDLEQAFYWLSDAVFVLRPAAGGATAAAAEDAGSSPADAASSSGGPERPVRTPDEL